MRPRLAVLPGIRSERSVVDAGLLLARAARESSCASGESDGTGVSGRSTVCSKIRSVALLVSSQPKIALPPLPR
jgi:hypothetical protein